MSIAALDADPHPVLARLRERAPVCWVPELGGWLVTGYRAASGVLSDAAAFTVDDPRFTTARVTGPSMLSTDGAEHARHRAPFAHAFGPAALAEGLAGLVRDEAARLAAELLPRGSAELREEFAGPLASAVMAASLGLTAAGVTAATVLGWYRDIVAAVAALPASGAFPASGAGGALERVPVASFGALAAALTETALTGAAGSRDSGSATVGSATSGSGHASLLAAAGGGLTAEETASNAAVALFGGIETVEGMICNAVACLLAARPASGAGADAPGRGIAAPGTGADASGGGAEVERCVEESLRLEPAAAVVDRYATRDVTAGGALVRRGDLVRVSIAGANRDPAVFPRPDQFDPGRPNVRRHLAFARGPHFCIGAHLARLEAVTAVRALRSGLPGLQLDAGYPVQVRGLVFRKPLALHARWQAPPAAG